MKKILLSVVILCLSLGNISAQKTITCRLNNPLNELQNCGIRSVTIGPNEAVTIKIDPENVNANEITYVWILFCSIYSLPREIFTKFPNLKQFEAHAQKVQEIQRDTFLNGTNLETINAQKNELTFLHIETFNGKNFRFSFLFSKTLNH
jgi:hypothetical protein